MRLNPNIPSQAKRDCVEEIEILLRYGQHKNIISLRDMFESPEEVKKMILSLPLYPNDFIRGVNH